MDKENASVIAPAVNSRATRGGVFGMLKAANNEAQDEHHTELAKLAAKDIAIQEMRAQEAREAADAELAKRLEAELQDELVAEQLEIEEKRIADEEAQKARDREEADARLAAQLASEEETMVAAAKKAEEMDIEAARNMQRTEISDFQKRVAAVMAKWSEPALEPRQIEDGVVIDVDLPGIGDVNVSIDPETSIIMLSAVPDMDALCMHADEIPEDMKTEAFDMKLDLRIIGKRHVSAEDVSTHISKRTGRLQVHIRNAVLRPQNTKAVKRTLMRRMKGSLKSMFSRSSSSDKQAEA